MDLEDMSLKQLVGRGLDISATLKDRGEDVGSLMKWIHARINDYSNSPIAMTGECPHCGYEFKFWIQEYMKLSSKNILKRCSGCSKSYIYSVVVITERAVIV